MDIQPIPDGAPFNMAMLHEGSRLASARRYEELTDVHLRHIATYDAYDARELAKKRAEAIEARKALEAKQARARLAQRYAAAQAVMRQRQSRPGYLTKVIW